MLLEHEIKLEDIKPSTGNEKMVFIAGSGVPLFPYYMRFFAPLIPPPGHGVPAILATLWIEGSLATTSSKLASRI